MKLPSGKFRRINVMINNLDSSYVLVFREHGRNLTRCWHSYMSQYHYAQCINPVVMMHPQEYRQIKHRKSVTNYTLSAKGNKTDTKTNTFSYALVIRTAMNHAIPDVACVSTGMLSTSFVWEIPFPAWWRFKIISYAPKRIQSACPYKLQETW